MRSIGVTVAVIVLTLVASVSACSKAAKGPVAFAGWTTHESMTSYQNPLGNSLTWTVTMEDLETSPPWVDPTEDVPPLSIADAVFLSQEEIATYFPDVETWILEDVALHTLGVEGSGKWFYVVSWRAKGSTGDALGIPVLMSGQAIALAPRE